MSTTLLARACSQSTNSFAPGTGRSCRAARRTWAWVSPRSRSARARNPFSQSIWPSIPARVMAATSASFPTIAASSGRNSLKIRVFSRSKTTSFTQAAIVRSRCGYLCSSAAATWSAKHSEDFHVSVDLESLVRDAVRFHGTRVLEPSHLDYLHDELDLAIVPFVEPEPDHAVGDVLDETVPRGPGIDRKSTRLNSSHITISYAVFCLKKKK